MAKKVFTDATFKYQDNSGTTHDISSKVQSVTLNYGAESQDQTAFGDDTRLNIAGLKNWSMTVTVFQDFSSNANLDSVLFDDIGPGNSQKVELIPDSTLGVDKNNPSFNGDAIITSYPPFAFAVGDVGTFDLEFQAAGTLNRSNSAQL